MADSKYTGTGSVASSDYKYIKWVGTTKAGKAVTIEFLKAFCISNIDWTIAEKDDIVAELEYEACYLDSDLADGDRTEPWTVTVADGLTAGAGEIMLGAGKFYLGTSSADAACVGLTRGGGSFVVERTYREINADDDPGKVADRVVQDEGRPKLKLNALQILVNITKLYSGVKATT